MGTSPECERIQGYIRNNLDNIDYPDYIRNGYFIGSGGVEYNGPKKSDHSLRKMREGRLDRANASNSMNLCYN
jgi:hypothetical protein